MILYFSATGNSLYVAQKVALDNEQVINMEQLIVERQYKLTLTNNERLIIVTPTYFFGLPNIVKHFFEKCSFENISYLAYIMTFGSLSNVGHQVKNIFKKKNIIFSAMFSVKMPDTFTLWFNLSDKEKVKRINLKADKQIDTIIHLLNSKTKGDYMQCKVSKPIYKIFYKTYDWFRRTKPFKVNDNCIGCSLCKKGCPSHAIEMQDNKPIWVKTHCQMCFKCLHTCPQFAISYTKITNYHGQYIHPSLNK